MSTCRDPTGCPEGSRGHEQAGRARVQGAGGAEHPWGGHEGTYSLGTRWTEPARPPRGLGEKAPRRPPEPWPPTWGPGMAQRLHHWSSRSCIPPARTGPHHPPHIVPPGAPPARGSRLKEPLLRVSRLEESVSRPSRVRSSVWDLSAAPKLPGVTPERGREDNAGAAVHPTAGARSGLALGLNQGSKGPQGQRRGRRGKDPGVLAPPSSDPSSP